MAGKFFKHLFTMSYVISRMSYLYFEGMSHLRKWPNSYKMLTMKLIKGIKNGNSYEIQKYEIN